MRFFLLMLCLFFLTGCAAPEPAPSTGVVVRMEVSCYPQDPELSRVYTSDSKMAQVLGYLRRLQGRPLYRDTPPEGTERYFIITAHTSTGQTLSYYQFDDRYLHRPGEGLFAIQAEQAGRLPKLLRENESDPH